MKKNTKSHKFTPTYLTPGEVRQYDAWKEQGFMDNYMLTLGTPPGQRHKSPQWFLDKWKVVIFAWKARNEEKELNSLVIANRGHRGDDKASAHVIFKGSEKPVDYAFLRRYWKNNFGSIWPPTIEEARKNDNGLRYWVKNYNERDPQVDGG